MEEKTIITSKFLSLNLRDLLMSLLYGSITTPITMIIESLNAGDITIDFKRIGLVALTGFLATILKKFLTPPVSITSEKP